MTWQAQRNSTISAAPERGEQSEIGLGFLQAAKSHIKTQYPCNDTKTAWDVFHDASIVHGFVFRCSSFVFVLEKGYCSSVLEK